MLLNGATLYIPLLIYSFVYSFLSYIRLHQFGVAVRNNNINNDSGISESTRKILWPRLDQVKKISPWLRGGLHHKPPKCEHICSCHNVFTLSSVQILLTPACCLLCVL